MVVVFGASRRCDWQLGDMYGIFIFDEAIGSGNYGVCALCLSLRGFEVLWCNKE